MIATAVRPTTIPAMMDSHGNPGIPGSASGVVAAVDVDADWVGLLPEIVVVPPSGVVWVALV